MRLQVSRLWTALIAAAFLVLWLAGVGVAYAAPAEEPLPQPEPAVQSGGAQAIGTAGWFLVTVGFLGVVVCAALGSRPGRRRRTVRISFSRQPFQSHPNRMAHSVYTPPPTRRYRRNIERRY